AQLEKMHAQLEQSILQSRDVMFLPEYELAEIARHGTAYEYRMSESRYPIKEIYTAAALSGQRSKQIAEKQIKLLTSPNKIVRYWAAVGLRSQPATILKPYRAPLLKAMNDPYPPVSVTAAAIAYDV